MIDEDGGLDPGTGLKLVALSLRRMGGGVFVDVVVGVGGW